MIYSQPDASERVDQGDIIRGCPILSLSPSVPLDLAAPEMQANEERVVVLTQTCDFAQQRLTRAVVAVAYPAEDLVRQSKLKATDIGGTFAPGVSSAGTFFPRIPQAACRN